MKLMSSNKYCDCDLSYNDHVLPSYAGDYDTIYGDIVGTLKFTRYMEDTVLMCIKHHPFFQQVFDGYKDETKASSCIAHAWTHTPTLTLKYLWSEKIEDNKEFSRYYNDLCGNVENEWQSFTNKRKARAIDYYCYDNNTFSNEDLDMIERDYPSGESAHIRHAYARGISVYKACKRWHKYNDSYSSDSSTN
jgi:hypothetical protein